MTTPPDEAPVEDPQVEDDDAQTRQEVLERIDAHDDDDNPWEGISTTAESVTVALEARVGCLVRVISWDLDGHFHMTTTWCHGVTLEDLRGARGRGRS